MVVGLLLLVATALALQMCFHSFITTIPLGLASVGSPPGLIGAVTALGFLVQIPAAIAVSQVIDWRGPARTLLLGATTYLVGSVLLAVPAGPPGVPFFVGSRLLLGLGIVTVLTSAYALVPFFAASRVRGRGLALVGVADNLAFSVAPLVSTTLFATGGIHAIGTLAAGLALVGLVLALTIGRLTPIDGFNPPPRRVGRVNASWIPLMVVTALQSFYFGTALAYLPPQAEAVAANAGIFFSTNGVTMLLLRFPAGFLSDVGSTRVLTAGGVMVTAAAVGLLVLLPTTETLLAAGVLSGAGAAFTSSPILTALSRRSGPSNRGRAFAALGASMAVALASGSLVGALLVTSLGFEAAMLAALPGLAVAFAVAIRDKPRDAFDDPYVTDCVGQEKGRAGDGK